jgi:hypothetical protein
MGARPDTCKQHRYMTEDVKPLAEPERKGPGLENFEATAFGELGNVNSISNCDAGALIFTSL